MNELVAAYFGGVATVIVAIMLWAYFFAPRDVPAVTGAHVEDDDDDDWGDGDWSPDDYLRASASSFDFWDNELDAEYDNDADTQLAEARCKP